MTSPLRIAQVAPPIERVPVLARRVGGRDEIIREGVDGFFGDDVTELASTSTGWPIWTAKRSGRR